MKKIAFLLILFNCFSCLLLGENFTALAAEQVSYERVVIISDAHYPTRISETENPKAFLSHVDKKLKAADTINSWKDVSLVVFTGDLIARLPSEKSLNNALQFYDRITQPKTVIAGNHEFFYAPEMKNGKKQTASTEQRRQNLRNFKEIFDLPNLYFTKNLGGYLLVFLSPDAVHGKYKVEMSQNQLQWLEKTLQANAATPTLIFYHAPLVGTLDTYYKGINSLGNTAQPAGELERILMNSPQVILWVSGHTHTPAVNPSFASPVNYYHGRILDIHNSTMEDDTIWTNSIYLYPDKIVIQTFNHQTGEIEDALTRTIDVHRRLQWLRSAENKAA